VAALFVAGMVYAALQRTGGEDATSTPAATVTAATSDPPGTPTTGSGTATPGTTPAALTVAQAIAPPADTVFYTVTGCYQCDGPDVDLVRHSVDSSGNMVSEVVLGPGHPNAEGYTPGGYVTSPLGRVLAAVTCDQEYCGGMGVPYEGQQHT
jgi:hypothetical protein